MPGMSLAPGCFGKLPLHADFIRHNAAAPELVPLDQWFQEGIVGARQALGRGWEELLAVPADGRFFFRAPDSDRILAGAYALSGDKAGRRYPFLLFTLVEGRPLAGGLSILPALLAEFLDRAWETATSGWNGLDLRSFLGRVEGLAASPDLEDTRRRFMAYLSGETADSLWGTAPGAMDARGRALAIQNLVDLVRPGTPIRLVLRYPPAPGAWEAAFWVELTLRLSGRGVPPTLILWNRPRTEEPPALSLVFDDLLPKYFVPLLWPGRESDRVCRLHLDGLDNERRVRQAEDRYGALLAERSLPLLEFIRRIKAS